MNDRFKFRAWHKEKQEMHNIEGLYAYDSEYTEGGEVFFEEDSSPKNSYYFPEEVEVMQCTGKKDTNGKLIYEDDIVELKAKNGMIFQYVVKFKDYCFILEYINGKLKGTKARNFAKQYAQPQRMYEYGYMVIGNIYENKELLNENS